MNRERADMIRLMRQCGYPYRLIGEKFGITRERVRQIEKQYAEKIWREQRSEELEYKIAILACWGKGSAGAREVFFDLLSPPPENGESQNCNDRSAPRGSCRDEPEPAQH